MTSARPQAIVTGGSRGIGRAICLALAKKGYDVAFTLRSDTDQSGASGRSAALEKEFQAFGGRAKGFVLDIADPSAVDSVMEAILAEFPAVEVLVNNAGIAVDGLAMRFKLEDYDRVMNTNARGAFLVTQSILRPMMKMKRGSIIFISSVIGEMGNGGQAVYSASKAALIGLTKSLAKEIGSRGIRVNAIAPGFIRTDMTESLPASSKEGIFAQIPLGTLGEAEDVAHAVIFLASSDARYITGHVLDVNGGLYM